MSASYCSAAKRENEGREGDKDNYTVSLSWGNFQLSHSYSSAHCSTSKGFPMLFLLIYLIDCCYTHPTVSWSSSSYHWQPLLRNHLSFIAGLLVMCQGLFFKRIAIRGMALLQNPEVLHCDSPVGACLGLHMAWSSLEPLDLLRPRAKQKALVFKHGLAAEESLTQGDPLRPVATPSPNKCVVAVFPNVAASKSQETCQVLCLLPISRNCRLR